MDAMSNGRSLEGDASWSVSTSPGRQSVINMRLVDGLSRQVTVRVQMSAPAIAELAQIISDFGQDPGPGERDGR